jgi:hypothetical protein
MRITSFLTPRSAGIGFLFILTLLLFPSVLQAQGNKRKTVSQAQANQNTSSEVQNELQQIQSTLQNLGNDQEKINEELKKLAQMEQNEESIKQTVSTPFWRSPSFWFNVGTVAVSILISAGVTFLVANGYFKRSSKDLEKVSRDLDNHILNIEEVTSQRHILKGFDQIFRKYETMIRNSGNFFWALSFTPNFGHIHTYNKSIRDSLDYSLQEEMNNCVIELRSKFPEKAEQTDVDFKLIYLRQGDFVNEFVNPVAQKTGSGLVNNSAEITKINESNSQAITAIKTALEAAKKNVGACMIAVDSVPLQIFISDSVKVDNPQTDVEEGGSWRQWRWVRWWMRWRRRSMKPPQTNTEERKKACLVFFVGNENVGVQRTPKGIYTELPTLVELFQNVFEGIVERAKTIKTEANP